MIREQTNSPIEDERICKEKKFHNKIFETRIRRRVSIFYSTSASIRNKFVALLEPYTSKRILEIGCGLGTYAFYMAFKGARVTAIDISEYAINEVRKKARNNKIQIDCRIMNAEQLEFGNEEFDLVYGISILHHLNIKKVIFEIKRVLKKDGKAVFIEPMVHNPLIRIFRFLTPKLRSRNEHPLDMKDLKSIGKEFSKYTFKHYYFFSLFSFPFSKISFYNKIRNILEKLDEKIFDNFPQSKKLSWQVLLILEK